MKKQRKPINLDLIPDQRYSDAMMMALEEYTSGKPKKPWRYRCQVNKIRYRFITLAQAARLFHIPSAVVRGRVRAGWRLSKALTTPIAWRKPRPYKPHPDVVAHAARVAKSAVNKTRH